MIYKRDCSTSPTGGNQVDGSPPAPSTVIAARRAEDLGSMLRVIPGRMPFGLICRLRNLLPGNRTEAISRNLIITMV